ncbi:ArnT family glycosyltransferase [Hymenobacter caeli]|uniref:4-amino-4-deoxy-L-arabinose transferase-like glycosyltransferase n=1 Tax=Hymenobacter caeli TaxID=2735894 RepID=A0ABX2FN19_9BACT|nr:hypothetical protein [Hymenobacter caeli]NRT17931.1 4-amino-4-deoxy-L-arabinose transferase-like glycosyltransferase [Hymenobacter caeli]
MSSFASWFQQRPWALMVLCLLVLGPALFIHLGLLPLQVDEPIRALVALELKDSGNYFVSTLQGVYYYNKPPLYNWLLLGLFNLTGSQSELVVRLPTVLSLLGYAATLFAVVRRYLGPRLGFVAAFAFITCGRMLFYDAFQGLIDTLHAWVTYLGFAAVFYFAEKGQWRRLFAITYALTAVGFMLKGLPSIAFQGITLVVFCWYTGNFKRLFSGAHFLGIGVFVALVGSYFLVYSRYNSLHDYFYTLWDQSSQRTVAAQPLLKSVRHVLAYPFDFLGWFAPWTLLVVCLVRRGWWQVVQAHPFLKFNAVIFLALTPIFWLSPATIPRYLFPLIPLLITVMIYFYDHFQAQRPWQNRVVDGVLTLVLAAVALALLAPPFIPRIADVPGLYGKTALVFGALAALAYLYYALPAQRLVTLCAYLLCLRVGFNWFVLPARYKTNAVVPYRAASIRVGRLTKGQPLYVYKGSRLDNDEAFYITRERGTITRAAPAPTDPNAYYLTEDCYLNGRRYHRFFDFVIDRQIHLNLVKFDDAEPAPGTGPGNCPPADYIDPSYHR